MHKHNDENLQAYWDEKDKRMKIMSQTTQHNKPQKFWMCWVSHKGSPMRRHPSQLDAGFEATRLARLSDNVGRKVYVLEATEYMMVDLNNLPVSITGL